MESSRLSLFAQSYDLIRIIKLKAAGSMFSGGGRLPKKSTFTLARRIPVSRISILEASTNIGGGSPNLSTGFRSATHCAACTSLEARSSVSRAMFSIASSHFEVQDWQRKLTRSAAQRRPYILVLRRRRHEVPTANHFRDDPDLAGHDVCMRRFSRATRQRRCRGPLVFCAMTHGRIRR